MAVSNKDTIEIKELTVMDGRKPLKRFDLMIDRCRRASVEEHRNGRITMRFDPTGSFDYQEAKVWLQGLLELSVHAEILIKEKGK